MKVLRLLFGAGLQVPNVGDDGTDDLVEELGDADPRRSPVRRKLGRLRLIFEPESILVVCDVRRGGFRKSIVYLVGAI